MTISTLFTPEITQAIKLILMFVAFFHVLVGAVLFRFIMSVSRVTQTPYAAVVKLVSTIHIIVLVGILVIVLII